jgi:hypothetical protein
MATLRDLALLMGDAFLLATFAGRTTQPPQSPPLARDREARRMATGRRGAARRPAR